jgi:AcrR family transcriptional regulator
MYEVYSTEPREAQGAPEPARSIAGARYDRSVTSAKSTVGGGRKRGPAPSLTLEQIVEAALRVLDAGGISALTTRRLAQEMGVGAMTLYSYVRTKEELLDRVAQVALAAMVPAPDPSLRWAENLAAAGRGIRQQLTNRPGTFEIMLATRIVSASSLDPAREMMLAPLLDAGFSADAAVDAVSAVQIYAFGFALAQRSHSRIGADEDANVRSPDPALYPGLYRTARQYADRFSERAFEVGLTDVISRIAAARE